MKTNPLFSKIYIHSTLLKGLVIVSTISLISSIHIHYGSLIYENEMYQTIMFPNVLLHVIVFIVLFPLILILQSRQETKMSRFQMYKLVFGFATPLLSLLFILLNVYTLLLFSGIYHLSEGARAFLASIGYPFEKINLMTMFSSGWITFYFFITCGLLSEIIRRKNVV